MVLKINDCEKKIMKEMYIGQTIYYINFSLEGYEDKIDDVAEFASSFKRILLDGEVFEQNDDVSELCKKIQKNNPYNHVIIKVDGTRRPVKFNAIKNCEFLVCLQLKKSGVEYNKRINEKAIEWFNKVDAKYVFNVSDNDDLDEVDLIVSNYLINKSQVFIDNECDNFKEVNEKIFMKNYNYLIKLESDLF